MNPVASILEPLRHLDIERWAGLRPAYPPVAVEFGRGEIVLARLRRKRRAAPVLEAHAARGLPAQEPPGPAPHAGPTPSETMGSRLKEVLEATGTRPGKIALVLPDNLARVSLMSFPERPPNRKHLEEMIRFKLRRAVPFRLEEALLSYQVLPGDGRGVDLVVALMLRSAVEPYERAAEAAGARPGLVDLSTLALYNLCRRELGRARSGGEDVALLNCAAGYFSLMIVRGSRPLFYRCKSFGSGEDESGAGAGTLSRELVTSLSYYQEKLGGAGIAATIVRTVAVPFPVVEDLLGRLGFGAVVPLDLGRCLGAAPGPGLDPEAAQRIAPAVGAAVGRSL